MTGANFFKAQTQKRKNMIAVSNKFTMFVVPRNTKTAKSEYDIFIRIHKAEVPFGQFYFGSLVFLGGNQGAFASFVTPLPNFFPKMPRNEKVSGTVNNSTRTASVKSYSHLKAEESPRKHLYKVRIDGYGRWRKSDSSSDHTADIYHTDIYEATSISEALGMAIEAVQQEHPFCDIYARRGNVKLLNSLA